MNSNIELIIALQKLGSLPSEAQMDQKEFENFDLEMFDDLLQQFKDPLTPEQALALLNLSPPEGTGSYGVEWGLLHLIETLPTPELRQILTLAKASEVKTLIANRMSDEN